ncbi:MAG: hypothetical protein QXK69_07950 [Candidatus Caldarchaeum sp.]
MMLETLLKALCFLAPSSLIISLFYLGAPWWFLIMVAVVTCPVIHLLMWRQAKNKIDNLVKSKAGTR